VTGQLAGTRAFTASGVTARRTGRHRHEDAGHLLHHLLGYDDRRTGEVSPGGAFGQAAR
jgi:hypothetical protein